MSESNYFYALDITLKKHYIEPPEIPEERVRRDKEKTDIRAKLYRFLDVPENREKVKDMILDWDPDKEV